MSADMQLHEERCARVRSIYDEFGGNAGAMADEIARLRDELPTNGRARKPVYHKPGCMPLGPCTCGAVTRSAE